MSVAGAQGVWAGAPVVDTGTPPVASAPEADTAAPPVVESSAPTTPPVDEPIVAVGLPPVPPTTMIVAVGLPPVPLTHPMPNPDTDAAVDAPEFVGAVSGALVGAALADWRNA